MLAIVFTLTFLAFCVVRIVPVNWYFLIPGVAWLIRCPAKPKHVVIYDLETTDLIRNFEFPDIVEIFALDIITGNHFHSYVKPTKIISQESSAINGFTNDDPRLINAPDSQKMIVDFVKWLESLESNIVLVAHNGNRFDHILMKRLMDSQDLPSITWIDSIDLFKKAVPGRSSYSLANLKNDLLPTFQGKLHDARNDVTCLYELLLHSLCLTGTDTLNTKILALIK